MGWMLGQRRRGGYGRAAVAAAGALALAAACVGVSRRALGGLPAGYAEAVAGPAPVAVEWLRAGELPLPPRGGADRKSVV